MHKPSLSQLVYSTLYPKPRANDPSSFASHISRNLVPEVRVETSTFYGSLDCIEAQYPGLDYCHPPHRMRLSRFHHHRKLFRIFDELKLTEAEIGSLCRWEGTKSARDRYEQDEHVRVRDTTADDIMEAAPSIPASIHVHILDDSQSCGSDIFTPSETPYLESLASNTSDSMQAENGTDESSSDEDLESYGVALNEHLLEATAARERGADVALDALWEQWLKDAIERGGYTDIIEAVREGRTIDFTYRGIPQHNSSSLPPPSPLMAPNTTAEGIQAHHSRRRPVPMTSSNLLSTLTLNLDPTMGSPNSTGRTAS